MLNQFSRTEMLLGREGMDKLKEARIAVFGVGGVGGYVAEALVRSGVGEIDLFDNDTVSVSNLNRQLIATRETIGRFKADVMRERALSVNPDIKVNSHKIFYMPDNADNYDFSQYSYIVDAVDTVTAKIEIIIRAQTAGVPVISCMGTGNKLDASLLEVADIYETSVCPLARVMRTELRKRGVKQLKVVYSKEPQISANASSEGLGNKRSIPGSTAFVPAAAGFIIAGEVVRDLIERKKGKNE
jgi:tRNA A37 threonylcarbamoyladenosine dehydratase